MHWITWWEETTSQLNDYLWLVSYAVLEPSSENVSRALIFNVVKRVIVANDKNYFTRALQNGDDLPWRSVIRALPELPEKIMSTHNFRFSNLLSSAILPDISLAWNDLISQRNLLYLNWLNFGIFHNFLSKRPGNTVWPQAIGLKKLAKMDHFWLTFVHSICKHSSLRSQHWMRLFGTGYFSQGADKPLWANNPFFISWIKRHFGQFMVEISALGFSWCMHYLIFAMHTVMQCILKVLENHLFWDGGMDNSI